MFWNRVRRSALVLAGFSLAVLMGLTALSLFARHGWMAELASHFRPQYFLLLLALCAGFAVARRPLLALLAAAAMLPNGWYVVPYALPALITPSIASSSGHDVSIVALNLFVSNDDYAAVRSYLAQKNADVLVLSELTPTWVVELRDITADYPYWVSVDRRTPWGLGVYSKYPLKDARPVDLGLAGSVNVVATVAFPGGDVQLVGAHLASPTSPTRAVQRNDQLEQLSTLLGPSRKRTDASSPRRLLVGDLNLTPFSPYFGELLERTGMVDARRQQGWSATWPTWGPPVGIVIDHCIVDPDLPVTSVVRGPAVGSDHYPLEIALRQRG